MNIQVNNVAFVNRALQQVSRDMRIEVQEELVEIAVPVRDEGRSRALGEGIGVEWSQLRIGQTSSAVYVVPVKKGTKVRQKKRPNFSGFMLGTAMKPALAHHAPEAQRRLSAVVDRVVEAFNRGH